MKVFCILMLLTLLTGMATAQENTPPGALAVIENVTLTVTQYDPVKLGVHVSGYFPSGCQTPAEVEQIREENLITITVYQTLDPLVLCPPSTIPYAETIELEGVLDADEYTIQVNDFTLEFTLETLQIENDPLTDGILPTIETISLIEMEEETLLLVSGDQFDGCDLPLEVTVEPDHETLYVTVTRNAESDMECPDDPVHFELTHALEKHPRAEGYEWLIINRFRATLDQPEEEPLPTAEPPTAEGDTMRVLHTIDSVDVLILESFPPQLTLEVRGWQGDGCDLPVQIEEKREGNHIQVEIFREMPPDMMCTMIIKEYSANIRLTGSFEPGTYTIEVNGVVVTVRV